MSNKLKPLQIEMLEQAYRQGLVQRDATRFAGCGINTAHSYFRSFKEQAVPRQHVPRRWYDVPVYTGPAWIGTAA